MMHYADNFFDFVDEDNELNNILPIYQDFNGQNNTYEYQLPYNDYPTYTQPLSNTYYNTNKPISPQNIQEIYSSVPYPNGGAGSIPASPPPQPVPDGRELIYYDYTHNAYPEYEKQHHPQQPFHRHVSLPSRTNVTDEFSSQQHTVVSSPAAVAAPHNIPTHRRIPTPSQHKQPSEEVLILEGVPEGFKLPASKSPIMDAMTFCALMGWGIEVRSDKDETPEHPAEVVFYVTDFDKYYQYSRAVCSKQNPTEDIGSRVKSLRRWFTDFPKKKDRKEFPEFELHVKPEGAKKVYDMIQRNRKLIENNKKRRSVPN